MLHSNKAYIGRPHKNVLHDLLSSFLMSNPFGRTTTQLQGPLIIEVPGQLDRIMMRPEDDGCDLADSDLTHVRISILAVQFCSFPEGENARLEATCKLSSFGLPSPILPFAGPSGCEGDLVQVKRAQRFFTVSRSTHYMLMCRYYYGSSCSFMRLRWYIYLILSFPLLRFVG
jgi:hypothetical protein